MLTSVDCNDVLDCRSARISASPRQLKAPQPDLLVKTLSPDLKGQKKCGNYKVPRGLASARNVGILEGLQRALKYHEQTRRRPCRIWNRTDAQ